MKRPVACPVACIALLAMASGVSARDSGHGAPRGGRSQGYANPSALIAAEIALHQLAQKKGLWKAYRENAAAGAELLTPEPVPAEPWLKDRAEPAVLPDWEPYAVWMSCDGSYGAVEGGWSESGSSNLYASIWRRQDDGSYKWLIRQRIGPNQKVGAPDMLSALVADCDQRGKGVGSRAPGQPQDKPQGKAQPSPEPVDAQTGYSADRTLFWHSGKDPDGLPGLYVAIRKGGEMQQVLGHMPDAMAGLVPGTAPGG